MARSAIVVNIFGIKLEIRADNSDFLLPYASFITSYKGNIDATLDVIGYDKLTPPIGSATLIENLAWVFQKTEQGIITTAYKTNLVTNKTACLLESNINWKHTTIKYLKTSIINKPLIPLVDIWFRNILLYHRGIIIHASSILWDKKCIFFSAPSETGKTTQANLWKKLMNARIINDDHSAIKLINSDVFAYGVPWSKTSETLFNDLAPLKAVIMLEQATVNSINQLTNSDTIHRLLPRCFLPYFSEDLMKIALGNIQDIINVVPVYLLKCRPDKEAVDLVYQCVK